MDTERREVPISEARANLSDLVSAVHLLRRIVFLTRRASAKAAVVPKELGEAAVAVGGADEAVRILRAHDATGAGSHRENPPA